MINLYVKDRELVDTIIERLCDDEILEPKYRDHKLKGSLRGLRECHIKPDLLLIYSKQEDVFILNALNLDSHSKLF